MCAEEAPFRDGNGRVSRLLLQCYHLGYEVGGCISLERLIEQNKERYYQSLEISSQAWHEDEHDPWPFANHFSKRTELLLPLDSFGLFEKALLRLEKILKKLDFL